MQSLSEIRTALREETLTLPVLAERYLQQIEATRHLNCYVEVYEQEVRVRAAALQEKFRRDPATVGKLFGMVVSVKDVLSQRDHRLSAGSRMLEGFEAVFTATALERLLAEDALIIGRTNCDEFAMGSTNETSWFGPVRNAADPERIPGGSSGGAAVSVQAGTCLAAIGSDTGGSVRQPAAFCGLIGLKPTYGRISRHGLIAYASSFDQIGIISKNIPDAAVLLEVMSGADPHDATCSVLPAPAADPLPAIAGRLRFAVFRAALEHPGLDPHIRALTEQRLDQIKVAGHAVELIDFPYLDYLIPAYYVLTTAEASSNLSRYDGVRYGYRSREAQTVEEVYRLSRTEGFGREVKRRILLGAFVLSAGYYDAYYARAQKIRRLIRDEFGRLLNDYDQVLLPASPTPPWRIGELADDPVAMYLSDIYTVPANLAGLPAVSIPVGRHEPTQLPVGLQLLGRPFEEALLLSSARNLLQLFTL